MYDVFISYSRGDIKTARQIKSEIEKRTSAKCWMDMDGIESGTQFQDVIISAINNSQIVVLLLSENSTNSHWVKKEINFAHEKGKKVVPINIDGSKPGDWFLFIFSGNDVIDYSNKDQQQKFFRDITAWCKPAIGGLIDDNDQPGVNPDDSSLIEFNPITKYGFIAQYVIWGLLGLASLWLTLTGGLRLGKSFLSLMLDVLIAGTIVSTYYMSKGKKIGFFSIVFLDFLELFIVCNMGTAAYSISEYGGFKTALYQNIWGLGQWIKYHSFVGTYLTLSLSAVMHIIAMFIMLKLKNGAGKTGWQCLK